MEIILDTPEQIARFALASLRGRLKLEELGMRCRGASALSIAKSKGYKGNRKAIIAKLTEELAR